MTGASQQAPRFYDVALDAVTQATMQAVRVLEAEGAQLDVGPNGRAAVETAPIDPHVRAGALAVAGDREVDRLLPTASAESSDRMRAAVSILRVGFLIHRRLAEPVEATVEAMEDLLGETFLLGGLLGQMDVILSAATEGVFAKAAVLVEQREGKRKGQLVTTAKRTAWQTDAQVVCRQVSATRPSISSADLADLVRERVAAAPAHDRVVKLVRAWRNAGVIPPQA